MCAISHRPTACSQPLPRTKCLQSSNKSQLSYGERTRTFIFAKVGAWQFLGDLETQFSFVGMDCTLHREMTEVKLETSDVGQVPARKYLELAVG